MGEVYAEVGIAAAIQLGTLLWFLSGMRSDVKNLTGWVRGVAETAETAKTEAAELKGRVDTLPCAHCAPRLRA
jgi:hypothetical protein